MKRIIYVSQRHASTNDEDVQRIVEVAEDFNYGKGITGLLISLPEYFYQVLEGPSSVVDELMVRIKCDQRHHNVKIFTEQAILVNQYGTWSMRHHKIDEDLSDYFWVLSKFAAEPNYDEIQTKGIEMMLLGLT